MEANVNGKRVAILVADGFEHQYVVIIPSRKLVVVRLGVTHNRNFSLVKLVNKVIAALPE